MREADWRRLGRETEVEPASIDNSLKSKEAKTMRGSQRGWELNFSCKMRRCDGRERGPFWSRVLE